ncbi:MAG: hypothetical protein HGA44_12885 [Cellulomonadaceae bacterium]|nr:hypothetical protein [Cellulomonadaceae bacterium]
MDELTRLPRSVVLALWLAGSSGGRGTVRRAVNAVQGDDEPHAVDGHLVTGATLETLVAAWSGPLVESAALLPVPGDVGLPPMVADLAVEAGECVLVHGAGSSWVAIPEVVAFGSEHDTGHMVTWTVHDLPDWRARLPGQLGTLAEAEQALRSALREATQALADLDVARWRPDAAAAIVALRSTGAPVWPLPEGLEPPAFSAFRSERRSIASLRKLSLRSTGWMRTERMVKSGTHGTSRSRTRMARWSSGRRAEGSPTPMAFSIAASNSGLA